MALRQSHKLVVGLDANWKRKIETKLFKESLFFKTQLGPDFPESNPDFYPQRVAKDWGLESKHFATSNAAMVSKRSSDSWTDDLLDDHFKLYYNKVILGKGNNKVLEKLCFMIANSNILDPVAIQSRFLQVWKLMGREDQKNSIFLYFKAVKHQIDSIEYVNRVCREELAMNLDDLNEKYVDEIVEGLLLNSNHLDAEKVVEKYGITARTAYLLSINAIKLNQNPISRFPNNDLVLGNWLGHKIIKHCIEQFKMGKFSLSAVYVMIDDVLNQLDKEKSKVSNGLTDTLIQFYQSQNTMERLDKLILAGIKSPCSTLVNVDTFESLKTTTNRIIQQSPKAIKYPFLNSVIKISAKLAIAEASNKARFSQIVAFTNLIHSQMREMKLYCQSCTYLQLMELFSRTQNLVRVKALFKQSQRRGFIPTVLHYYYLIKTMCDRGSILQAKNTVLEMIEQRVKPTNEICNLLIRAYLLQNVPNVAKAFRLLEQFPNLRIVENNETHNLFSTILLQPEYHADINTWISILIQNKADPSPIVYNTLLKFHHATKNTQSFEDIVKAVTFTGFCNHETIEICLKYYGEFKFAKMVTFWNELHPSLQSQQCHEIALSAAFESNNVSIFRRLSTSMLEKFKNLTQQQCQLLFSQCTILCPSLCHTIIETKMKPNLYSPTKEACLAYLKYVNDDARLVQDFKTYLSISTPKLAKSINDIEYPRLEFDSLKLHTMHVEKKLLEPHYRRIIRKSLQTSQKMKNMQ